ncbi:uncharacterized protein LOC143212611 [Lasioglossum baleicum]|uniref:uncharacterized protein LOC143212611 n=1 Tax=Lasioglossum baleicum TaxID=434251 RepID=UPI003FCCF3AB
MSKIVGIILLSLCLTTSTNGQGSLLAMSQDLWSKLLSGGIAKAGKLDPLKVPVIKVDQSEGDTSYRIILRNVEITGLNESTLDSIHIAKGRLKSNLSELEAGYVSYSDLRDLDAIRYRFHTLMKEPKLQNESFEAIVSATNQESKFKAASREQESRFERLRQYDPFLMKIQADQMREPADRRQKEQKSSQESNYGGFNMEGARVLSRPEIARMVLTPKYPADVQMVYALNSGMNSRLAGMNYQSKQEPSSAGYREASRSSNARERFGDRRDPERYEDVQSQSSFGGRKDQERYENVQSQSSFGTRRDQERYEDVQSQSREGFGGRRGQERYEDVQSQSREGFGGRRGQERYEDVQSQSREDFGGRRGQERYEDVQSQSREGFGGRRGQERYEDVQSQRSFGGKYEDVQTAASENFESKATGQAILPGAAAREPVYQERLEKQPGYIDIVYADGSSNGGMKRFGNRRIESKENARVYGVKEIPKDLLEKKKMVGYNCSDGEPLTKRNEKIKAAIEGKSLKDLSRYAKNYQEQQGFFEEGMQLIYHYGGMNKSEESLPGSRQKRAHKENATDDDVMHVILKIRVPNLRIKSDYQLTGKVGTELVSGNGRVNGNFSELVGDFTIELKRVKDQDMLIVRAARSKLKAKDQKVDFQGMDEKGPVKSILSHGLMAAEAVAAMLADDLATKALNEKSADAMIYRMYKNLPVN